MVRIPRVGRKRHAANVLIDDFPGRSAIVRPKQTARHRRNEDCPFVYERVAHRFCRWCCKRPPRRASISRREQALANDIRDPVLRVRRIESEAVDVRARETAHVSPRFPTVATRLSAIVSGDHYKPPVRSAPLSIASMPSRLSTFVSVFPPSVLSALAPCVPLKSALAVRKQPANVGARQARAQRPMPSCFREVA